MNQSTKFLWITFGCAFILALLLMAQRAIAGDGAGAARDLPFAFAALFPVGALAGGAALGRSGIANGTRIIALGGAAAAMAFVLSGYIAPYVGSLFSDGPPVAFDAWVREYRRLLADRAAGKPVLDWMIAASGLSMWQPLTAAALTFVLTPVGSVIGARTDRGPARQWLAGAVVLATVALSYRAVLAMTPTQSALTLGLAHVTVVAGPALMLAGVMWGGRNPRET